MPSGRLVCEAIDLNDPTRVSEVLAAAQGALSPLSAWRQLEVDRELYFRAEGLRSSAGWYIICDGNRVPLYVGKAEDLNRRLNSTNGSLDQFANSKRKNDPERNFLKRLQTCGVLKSLVVGIVEESEVAAALGVRAPLAPVDRSNIEKLLNIFRSSVVRSAV